MSTLNFDTLISDITFSVVDTETTGMNTEQGALVEIAAVQIVPPLSLDLPNAYSSLINPQMPIPPMATIIHGITDEMVENAPYLTEVMKEFAKYVKNSVVIAHNAPFDCKFINNAFFTTGVKSTIGHVFDSVKIARKLMPHLDSHSLDSLICYFGVSSPRESGYRHRALFDADHTAIIMLNMLRQIQELGFYTLGDLYEFVT